MIRRPPRSTLERSSAASDVYKRQAKEFVPAQYMDRKDARRRDRFEQLATVAANEAMRHSGLTITDDNRERVGITLGTGVGGMRTIIEQEAIRREGGLRRLSPFGITMIMPNGAAGMLAIDYGIQGPSTTVTTACAAGNDAVGHAYRAIRYGELDAVLTGGTECIMTSVAIGGFGRAGAPTAELAQAVMASCAIPGWYQRVVMGHRRFIDGGACHDALEAMSESPTPLGDAPAPAATEGVDAVELVERAVTAEVNGKRFDVKLFLDPSTLGAAAPAKKKREKRAGSAGGVASGDTVVTPMQGTGSRVPVAGGQTVAVGDGLVYGEGFGAASQHPGLRGAGGAAGGVFAGGRPPGGGAGPDSGKMGGRGGHPTGRACSVGPNRQRGGTRRPDLNIDRCISRSPALNPHGECGGQATVPRLPR